MYFRKWEVNAWKIIDPFVRTLHSRKTSKNPEITASQNNYSEEIMINRKIIINQAIVNKELEEEQKKKALKLLNINQSLGLIKISIIITKKHRLYSHIFFNNFMIFGTFEPRRYEEFEHYLKILQEEKVYFIVLLNNNLLILGNSFK